MFKKILKLFSYQPLIGGLEINDFDLRFIHIKKGNVFPASVKLEPETVKDGKIQNRQNFLKALNQLHSQITNYSRKKICVIATIPDNNVYAQIFNLPESAEAQLEEAAKLNLQMISPIDFERAYSDWQAVGKSRENGLEILGAFIHSELIDELDDSLREANFAPVAIEFSSLSLARLASELGEAINPQNPFILFNVGANAARNRAGHRQHWRCHLEQRRLPCQHTDRPRRWSPLPGQEQRPQLRATGRRKRSRKLKGNQPPGHTHQASVATI